MGGDGWRLVHFLSGDSRWGDAAGWSWSGDKTPKFQAPNPKKTINIQIPNPL
jgi:hypothetical protein